MTTIEHSATAGRRPVIAATAIHAARAAASLARLLFRAFRREMEARAAEHRLLSMPDAMLKDIGISRGDISRRVREHRN